MTGREKYIRICRILIILNLCFIWGNSLLPAEMSQTLSDGVKSLLDFIASGDSDVTSGSGLLRKAAHFTEFTALGLLLSCLCRLQQRKQWYPMPVGVAAACVDESIQFFVPGRSPGVLDVCIDSCGVLTGILLIRIGYYVFKRKQTQYGGK